MRIRKHVTLSNSDNFHNFSTSVVFEVDFAIRVIRLCLSRRSLIHAIGEPGNTKRGRLGSKDTKVDPHIATPMPKSASVGRNPK